MIGVTKFIKVFQKPKDWDKIAKKVAKEKDVTVPEIKQEWEESRERGIKLHEVLQTREETGENVESFRNRFSFDDDGNPKWEFPEKDTQLENGKTYLERPVYSFKQGLWGFPDRVEVIRNTIHLLDNKSWKDIYWSAPGVKVGIQWIKPKMLCPIDHLDDCNTVEATLQLSLYMYMLWENNRHLKVGKLHIRHIITNAKDDIIREDLHEVPYLRDEVRDMLKYKKLNQL